MTQLFFEDIEMGKQIPSVVNKVDLLQLLRYAAATWNFYLLHLEKEFARNRGFRDVNIRAPFYGAMLATMISCWTEDPRNLRKLAYSVKVMGFPSDTLSAKGRVVRKYQRRGNTS